MAYRSSFGKQLDAIERRGRRIFETVLKRGAKRFLDRFRKERLSGPPGLNRVTGRLYRSSGAAAGGFLSFRTVTMRGWVGGSLAPHAEELEANGLLGFGWMFDEEAEKTLADARLAARSLGRGGGA